MKYLLLSLRVFYIALACLTFALLLIPYFLYSFDSKQVNEKFEKLIDVFKEDGIGF